MTMHAPGPRPRKRLRAVLLGLGPDDGDAPRRIISGEQCLIIGGSEQAQREMLETVLRLEAELERRDRSLGEVSPAELAEIAWTIDSPELHRIALRLHRGLSERGRSFHEATAEQLTDLSLDEDV